MPQPITHFLVIKNAMRDTLKNVWKSYGNFAGLGSFGPDLFYMKDVGYYSNEILKKFFSIFSDTSFSYDKISDIMHWEGSLELFCSFLDYIAEMKHLSRNERDKLRAFAYGYYSHVITDAIFHPYVYRYTKDHWKTHDSSENYLKHKKLESTIDRYLLGKLEKTHAYKFEYHKKIRCYEKDSDKTLENSLFMMLVSSMEKVYKQYLDSGEYREELLDKDYDYYFGSFNLHDEEHPIHEAYDDFTDTITELYTIKSLKFIPIDTIQVLLPRKSPLMENEKMVEMNEILNVWPESGENISLSVYELYLRSEKATKQIITASEDFLNSGKKDSKSFFAESYKKLHFLRNSHNLDTGLNSSWNRAPLLNSTENERFSFNIEEIKNNLKI